MEYLSNAAMLIQVIENKFCICLCKFYFVNYEMLTKVLLETQTVMFHFTDLMHVSV